MMPLRVLIVTDAFPPGCGGSGWSTWELAAGLRARGHAVEVIKIAIGRPSGVTDANLDGLPVTTFRMPAPAVPVLRNVVKNERLWRRLSAYLQARLARDPVDVLHAQHVMSTVPAIRAGAAAGVPVVATVRDYWPVCYWSDLIYDPSQPHLCGGCTAGMMTRCIRPRAGGAWPLALPLIPYMRANLAAKRAALERAAAVIAVSSAIARDLRMRVPDLDDRLLHQIPNPIDMQALDAASATAPPPIDGPYVLYAGKLATNKGVQFLAAAVARAGIRWPVVVAGDGPLRAPLEADARQQGLDLRVLGWQPRETVWQWMRHAAIVAFPSYGPESLSRVLIEAAALGAPIAAMETGGTRDILSPATARLSADPAAFGRDLAALAGDGALRRQLGTAARADVLQRFAAPAVVERIEGVYRVVTTARPSPAVA